MPNYDLGTAEGKIVLDSSGVDNAVANANQSMGRLGKGVQSAERMGRDLTLGLTVPIVAAGGYALKTAIDFETAFAGVTKTVSASKEEIASLRQSIIDMSLEIPATTTEIAGVAEAAGQLGIAVPDIDEFTRVMIDLGVATNLSSTEAADAIAHITNVMGTGVGEFGNFGAALVGLGNDSAATESEILEMANRISGIADLTGASEAEMLSLAATLASVGVRAEAGGTSVTRTIKDFDKFSLAIQEAGGNVEEMDDKTAAFYNLIGGQPGFDSFVTQDGIRRFETFITKLQEARDGGGNLIGILDDMGIKQIRQSDAILRVSGAEDLLTRTLAVGDKAWEDNTALTKEATKRYETTASQLQILHNKADNAARIFGEAMIPLLIQLLDAITPLLEGLATMAEAFGKLPAPVKNFILMALALLAALGPVIFIGAKIVRTAMALGKAIQFVATVFRLLGLAAAANPFVLIALAIAALVIGFILLYKKSEKFRNFINGLGEDIKRIWEKVVEFFKALPAIFSEIWRQVSESFVTAKDAIVNAWNSVVDFFKDLGQTIADAFNTAKDAVAGFATSAIDKVTEFFTKLPGIIAGAVADAFKAFVDFMRKLPETAAYWIGFVIGRFIKLHIDLVKLIIKIGVDVVKAVVNFMTKLPGIVIGFLTSVMNHFIKWGTDLTTWVVDIFTQFVSFAISKLGEFVTWLPGFLSGLFQKFVGWGQQLISWAFSTFTSVVTNVVNALISLPGKVAGFFTQIISALPGYATSFFNGAKNVGEQMVKGLVGGIGDLVKLVKDMVMGAINGVSDLGQTAYNKMKSVGESMWNGFKKGLFGSPHTKVEYAVWAMTDNVDVSVKNLAEQVRKMQTLSRGIPLTASAEPFVGSVAASAISAGLTPSVASGGVSAAGMVYNQNAPLINEATIRDDRDIYTLARELADEQDRRMRGRGVTSNG